jgi:hypothetical protein
MSYINDICDKHTARWYMVYEIREGLDRTGMFLFLEQEAIVGNHGFMRTICADTESQGFYNPVNDSFIEPSHTGISYSFTSDGYYEEAYYRAISNRT